MQVENGETQGVSTYDKEKFFAVTAREMARFVFRWIPFWLSASSFKL